MREYERKVLPLAKIKANQQNPRIISESKLKKLVNSLLVFPKMLLLRPITIDEHNFVLGGNMRQTALGRIAQMTFEELQAYIEQLPEYNDLPDGGFEVLEFWQKFLEKPQVEVQIAKGLSDNEKQQFIIKDNVSFGDWDYDELENWDSAKLESWGIDTQLPDFGDEMAGGGKSSEMDKFKSDPNRKGNLFKRFVVPPFSVLDTRQGYWQERKTWWLEQLGNLSETRDSEFGKVNGGSTMYDSLNGGTSNFDPVLAETIYRWFLPVGGKILDPFGGEQTKGFVAGSMGYEYDAVEFRDDQVKLNRKKTKQFSKVYYTTGDSNNISKLIDKKGFDLVFTSPPYYDLEVYSSEDMSALGTYEEFMRDYENIFSQCVDMMADNRFLVVKVAEIRDKKTGIYRNFIGDNIALFRKLGLHYYNEIILVNSVGTSALRANKAMATRKIVKLHQNVLVFYKGRIENIKKNFPMLEIEDDKLTENGFYNVEAED